MVLPRQTLDFTLAMALTTPANHSAVAERALNGADANAGKVIESTKPGMANEYDERKVPVFSQNLQSTLTEVNRN
jgi:hypothetical protein